MRAAKRHTLHSAYVLLVALQLGALTWPGASLAQVGPAPVREALSRAEVAYDQVDFAGTSEAACNALELGNASSSQSLRLHLLCAIASAALEKPDEARAHFKVALAMRPELRLERELSPKIRSPYLEAQGYWAQFEDRLSLQAATRSQDGSLQFRLVDPARLTARIRVQVRVLHAAAYELVYVEASPTPTLRLGRDETPQGLEYYAALVDAHDNVLLELGSEATPIRVNAQRQRTDTATAIGTATQRAETPKQPARSLWLPLTLVATGAAAAGAGVYFNVVREKEAEKWNGPQCEQPGQSRLEQCGSTNTDRIRAERAAIGLYAAGGVLLTTGLSILIFQGPTRTEHHERAAASTPIRCGAAFPAAAVVCAGQF